MGKSWSHKLVTEEAKKFSSRNKFSVNSRGAYCYATRHNIINEICSHMKAPDRTRKWTKEKIIKEALKYNRRVDFKKKSSGAYKSARKRGIIDNVCLHMKKQGNLARRKLYAFEFPDKSVYVGLTLDYNKRYNGHMNKSKIIIEKTNKIGHTFIMFNELFSVNIVGKKEEELINSYKLKGWKILNKYKAGGLGHSIFKWNKENLKKEAKKYKTRNEFKENSSGAYSAAKRLKIFEDVCLHMKPLFRWKIEDVKKEALKYKNKRDFKKKSSRAYSKAYKSNILNEICKHMKN